jgi:hypothetical protein
VGEVDRLGVETERAAGSGFRRCPPGACSRYLYGAEEPRMFMFPSLLAGAKDQPWPLQRPEDQPSSGQGSTLLLRWRIEEELPPSR